MATMTKLEFLEFIIQGGEPRNLDLTGLDLSNEPKLLAKKDWSNAILSKVNFSGSNLKGGNFDNALMESVKLDGTDMSGSTFLKANLSAARGSGTILKNSRMDDANLNFALRSPVMDGVSAERSLFPRRNEFGVKVEDKLLTPEYGQWRDPKRMTAIKELPEKKPEFSGKFSGAANNY